MARLNIVTRGRDRFVDVTLSRRNLLTLLHKLDKPGSFRMITSGNCSEEGRLLPYGLEELASDPRPRTTLVLRVEDDTEHYGGRPYGPGPMHPATERFVAEHGGAPGEGSPPLPPQDPEQN